MSNPSSLMPHSVCWAAAPRLIWTMVVTNLITFVSYLSICITLLYLARRTGRVIARDWAYFVVGFALFIVACGSTHLLEVVTTWIPVFWIGAWTNIVTAALSAYVAVMLIRRAAVIGFSINDYAARLANTETERLKMQESLFAAQKNEEWSRISAIVSHEIRGPLEAIQNLQYLIRNSTGVTPEMADLARIASEEASRALTISDSTLSFIRQGKQQESLDMRSALESVRVLLDPLIRKKRIDFQTRIEGNCVVQAFTGETRQVLLNLIRNACEAVTPGSLVTVEIIGELKSVKINIIDEGPGIPPDILPQLFQFGISSKGDQGNGMGLWTVKHILNKHGGDIRVDSTRTRGTCFNLWWPRNGQPAPN